MQIDWITVSAQIVNFLVLVWLLRHFLYQPVMRAMARREAHIEQRLSEASQREQRADARARNYDDMSAELERRREQMLAGARDNAEEQRKALLEAARDDVAEMRRSWEQQIREEQQEFLRALRRQAAETVQTIARRALADLADADLEAQVLHAFIGRLEVLDRETRAEFAASAEPVQVRSAFALDSATRAHLTRTIHDHLGAGLDVDYVHSPELICGIELSSAGRRLSWNLADYLDELSERAQAALSPLDGSTGGVAGFAPGTAR